MHITLREGNGDVLFPEGLEDGRIYPVQGLEIFPGGNPVAQAEVDRRVSELGDADPWMWIFGYLGGFGKDMVDDGDGSFSLCNHLNA